MTDLAPAKVNLALHVIGRRVDGYHLLDSLVVFADIGDRLHIDLGERSTLTVTGPFAEGVPTGPENLIWKAHAQFPEAPPLNIHLEKNLPHAAGIGGGSSDAAALIRALTDRFSQAMPSPEAVLSLGADVPVCLSQAPQRMAGIGERLTDAPPLPPLALVLVNPGVSVPTGAVFKAMTSTEGRAMDPMEWGAEDLSTFTTWLLKQRNDLEPPARTLAPEIGTVLDALADCEGCLLARMSGSGATCFGLFDGRQPELAKAAAQTLKAAHPGWWVEAAAVLSR